MPVDLLITNVVGILCGVLTLIMGLLVLVKGRDQSVSIPFFLLTVMVAGFYVSHLLGINAHNAEFAYDSFMWNLVNIGIVCFNTHFILALIGKVHRRLPALIMIYGTGIVLLVFYLVLPEQFLLMPVSKMYLPFYYVPGPLYWLMRVYFVVVAVYMLAELALYYRIADEMMRNRLRFVFISHIYAYAVGSIALFLVYNIPVNPMWAMFFGLYLPPLVYGILKYDLIDLRLLAKRALLYAAGVAVVSLVMGVITTLNTTLVELVPHFSPWIIPIVSGVIAIGIASVVWNRMREVDVLKYDFISIVTHKFWTPVTHMKMAVDELKVADSDASREMYVKEIESSASHLFELTKVLIGLSDTENESYRFTSAPVDISVIVAGLISDHRKELSEKEIRVSFHPGKAMPQVVTDREHIGLALRLIIENAINYTPRGGSAEINLAMKPDSPAVPNRIACTIKDTGIGISQEEKRLIFDKFFRGHRARLMYTEGLGVSLFIAKRIIERAGGALLVHSDGLDKGASFVIEFPLVRERMGMSGTYSASGGKYRVPMGFVGKKGMLSHSILSTLMRNKGGEGSLGGSREGDDGPSIFSDTFMDEAIARARRAMRRKIQELRDKK